MDWKTDVHFKYQAGFSLATLLVFSVLYSSPAQKAVDSFFTYPLQYRVRSLLGKAPQLDKRVRIINFDDTTAAKFGKHDFRIDDWARIIKHIASYEPASIFIDKQWSMPIGRDFNRGIGKQEAEDFVRTIKSLKTRIIVGASVSENLAQWRRPLKLNGPPYNLDQIVLGSATNKSTLDIPWLPVKDSLPSGAHELIAPAFEYVGHFNYDSVGVVDPFIRFDETHVLPHAGLLASGLPFILDQVLLQNGREIPLDQEGKILLNLPDPKDIHSRADRLLNHILKKPEKFVEPIAPGDYVAILPLMYTGNVDYVDTPVGRMAGGYIPVTLINSALTGQWLRPLNYGPEIVLLAILLSWLTTRVQTVRTFLITSTVAFMAFVLFPIYLFTYHGIVISWMIPAAAFVVNSSSIFGMRTYLMERRSSRLKHALQGVVPPEKLERIINSKSDFKVEPAEKLVTIMFIDLVGFSLAAEDLSPEAAFKYLKEQLTMMTTTVHRHNGIVDKNLGDGILCFFGDDSLGGSANDDQANIALQCAIDIQTTCVLHSINAEKSGSPVFPVRIGINTAPSYVGDIGDRHRIDFTLIGKGVNFASRLEAACEPFKIMLGKQTYEMASRFQNHPGLHQRMVQIKHFDSLFDAYEFNPFFKSLDQYNQALEAYRKYRRIVRQHQRVALTPQMLTAVCEASRGEMVNVSHSGIGVKFDRFLAKGVSVKVHLEPKDHPSIATMYELKLLPFTAQVCWGAHLPNGETYLHGLQISSLNDSQKDQLFELFQPFFADSAERAS